MKNLIIKLIKEFLRAGFAATIAALGITASGCASVPFIFF